jgi:tetratricopeptide (TPR) repeat protein
MKSKKPFVAIIIALILGGVLFTGRMVMQNHNIGILAKHVASFGPKGGTPQTIAELKRAIKMYESRIEAHVKDAAQAGIYWKILASRFIDKQMYDEALDAASHGLKYTPQDPTLYYMAGISAGNAAKSLDAAGRGAEKASYFRRSEEAYKRAIEIDSGYGKPLYGLAVLYTFELNRPAEAIPLLLKYLSISRNDTEALFVLARAYFMTGAYQQSVNVYDKIISLTKGVTGRPVKSNASDAAKLKQAQENREKVMDLLYAK